MGHGKSKIAILLEDVIALHESIENRKPFDPDKTIYDLKTKSIKNGTAVILVRKCNESNSSLIMIDNDLFWVQSEYLFS